MWKKLTAVILTAAVALSGCGVENKSTENAGDKQGEKTEIQVFIAASLNTVMTELAKQYNEKHPEVKITFNADSSGTLMTQIKEGYECDLFFCGAKADG